MRNFSTGATRDSDENKFDYEGFLNPLVIERFAAYMHKHRFQADGTLRDSDNWQKGIPKDAYMKSMFRHFMDVWKNHRGIPSEDLEESLTALMFNVMGYLYETLKDNDKRFFDYIDAGGVDSRAYEPIHPISITNVIRDYDGDPAFAFEEEDNHYTHRYGALAHDQESIAAEEEGFDAEAAHGVFPGSTTQREDENASLSRTPGMEYSQVLRVPAERAEGEVATLAPEVRGVEPGEASIQAGCKW